MIREKKIFVYTILAVFVAIAAVGVGGALGWLQIADGPIVSAILGPCLGIVVALLNAKHVFDDPEAVTKLKQEHHDSIAKLKAEHTEAIVSLKQTHAHATSELKQSHSEEVSRVNQAKTTEIADLTAAHAKVQKELKSKISSLEYPGPIPATFMGEIPGPASKSAFDPARPFMGFPQLPTKDAK